MITLAEAKLHCKVDDDITEDDALITSLISAAYQNAEKRTRQSILSQSKTLVLDGFPSGDTALELPWTPVQEITEVQYVDANGETQDLTVPPLRLDTRPLYPLLSPQYGSDWPTTIAEPESVTITATVGYAATPDDIRSALLLLIGHLYLNRESVVIGTISSELPMGVEMLLGPYEIPRVG